MLSGRGPIIMINLGETALSWDGMSAASMQQAWFPGWCHSVRDYRARRSQ
jgi:hypothetical protein